MTQQEIEFVRWCAANDIHRFYVWTRWKQVRQQVLKMDHNECQRCREHHRYTAATTVHHVNYVKRHPEIALDIWYEWHGVKKRNLISLCHECHEAVHGYRKPQKQADRGTLGLIPPGRKICDFWRPAGDRWVASTNLRKVAHDEKIKK